MSNTAGRFANLGGAPLFDVDEDGIETPNYLGQTRALAESMSSSLIDLAGGCVGVLVAEGNGHMMIAALDPDGEDFSTVAIWTEDENGDRVGGDEPALLPFTPFI